MPAPSTSASRAPLPPPAPSLVPASSQTPGTLPAHEGSRFLRYGVAVASVALAFAVQQGLWSITHGMPFLAFFAAVMFSGWRGGWGPGLVATGLSLVTVDYFFLTPVHTWKVLPGALFQLSLFLALSLFVTMLNARLRKANAERATLLERERAARAAAEYERTRLRELFMHAPAHLAIFRGPDHLFELSNPLNSAMLGNPDLLGKPAREVGTKEEAERISRLLDTIYATGEPFQGKEIPLQLKQPDGSVREYYFDVTYTPTHDTQGRVDGVAGFGFDVTEHVKARARAEQLARELSHNEEHLRLLAGASSFLATSLDYEATLHNVVRLAVPTLADWCIVDMAMEDGTYKRMEVAHARTESEALAERLRTPPPEACCFPMTGAGALLSKGQAFFVEDVTDAALLKLTEDPGWMELLRSLRLRSFAVVPLVARERTLGVISFATSHASGRHYTMADLPFLQELANRAALSMENARLYREAREAVRLRDEFLSIASHELKTPLTPLNLKLQSLRREMDRTPGPVSRALVESYLEVGTRQLKKLAELVNDLLDVSRIASGRMSLNSARVDLAELVRDVVASYEGPAARAGSVLRVEGVDAVTEGWWDRPRLEQVVVNLVDNAIKYGQGRPIDIRLETRDGHAVLTVRDQGIGIAAESLPRLFGRFERAVSERHYGGLGLGLYITRTLVEAMGGTVRVESQLGQGAVFTVDLPLRAEQPAGLPAPS
ncbi:ATP-binding protein [Corallococcus sp. BB11-1]|uniref:sensor histidine kinase n=1 Tax=Corallococcus sp. BB11-1 TaxID=2996783 RepID=UPI00226FDD85|nr:ATP-binding protein [Corallococcus sp. BB11-1]MCY1032960.1 ATP-binding protein [Corallococcus sp. BB11-1]